MTYYPKVGDFITCDFPSFADAILVVGEIAHNHLKAISVSESPLYASALGHYWVLELNSGNYKISQYYPSKVELELFELSNKFEYLRSK